MSIAPSGFVYDKPVIASSSGNTPLAGAMQW